MNIQNQDMECVIPKETFEKLRDDRQFIRMLQLARFQNQLSFCIAAVPSISDPHHAMYRDSRQLINAMLFGSAILFEGIGQLKDAMAHFKWYATYKNDFRPFIKDSDTNRVRERYLKQLRNTSVSHVDSSIIADTLKWVTYEKYALLGGSKESSTIYYPLADNIGFTAAMGFHENDEAEMVTILDYFQTWSKVTVAFNAVVNKLILEYMEKKGWGVSARTFEDVSV